MGIHGEVSMWLGEGTVSEYTLSVIRNTLPTEVIANDDMLSMVLATRFGIYDCNSGDEIIEAVAEGVCDLVDSYCQYYELNNGNILRECVTFLGIWVGTKYAYNLISSVGGCHNRLDISYSVVNGRIEFTVKPLSDYEFNKYVKRVSSKKVTKDMWVHRSYNI